MYRSEVLGLVLAALPCTLAQASAWAQCGGANWSGTTSCVSGYTCVAVNSYYSQCQPGSAAATSTPAATASPTGTGSGTSSTATGLIKCPIIFDGRVPTGTSLSYFDSSNALFNPDYVKGAGLAWDQILLLPSTTPSKFDGSSYEAVEVTLSDKSIFNNQNGFRRAGLQFNSDSSQDSSDSGVATIHFSVKQDSSRAMNLSHEYLV
jgi:hypothetical protein